MDGINVRAYSTSMTEHRIYLDNHATTRVDPRVVEAMLPTFVDDFGNPASATHIMGQRAHELVERAREVIAEAIGAASPRDIVFTSGATESNNLALRGLADRRNGGHIISVATEHPSILAPLEKLGRLGFRVTLLPVNSAGQPDSGVIDLNRLAGAFREDTFLVSIMVANNEIGAIQPMTEIATICQQRGVRLHTDATQAVGKMNVNVQSWPVDLMSFTAHKIYGPKGIGALYQRRSGERPVRLMSQIDGGKQEHGSRGGTLNVPGIVGFARALTLALSEMATEQLRLCRLRNQLYGLLSDALGPLPVNGPALDAPDGSSHVAPFHYRRLPGNLNCQFPGIDGHTLMVRTGDVCLSSGSACTATSSEPSYVLKALGLDDDRIRCSLRFGLGRFNTESEILRAAARLIDSARSLHQMA